MRLHLAMYICNMDFPMYRKYADGSALFEIISEVEFRELKKIGSAFEIHRINAKILPERNYIADLINNNGGHYVEISKEEFEAELTYCQNHLRQLP